MRVLFLTGEFPPMQGGVGDCTNEIAKELAGCGANVRVLTCTQAVGDPLSPVKVLPTIARWDWSIWSAIWNANDQFSPDIIHIQYQTGAFGMHPAINLTPRFMKLPNAKFVTTFHDLREPYLFPKAGPVRGWVTRQLAQSCDAVIATNDEDYMRLATWHPRDLNLIPIGSNVTTTPPADYDRAAWRAKLGVGSNEILLCYFGFLNESKGGETLVRALVQIPNAKLVMIGGQTGASDPTNVAYLAQVKSLIAELGLGDRILWTDHAPAEIISANFYAADVCVLPYRDGASYRRGTLMAALAHGLAIVTTVVNRPSSVVRNRLPPLESGKNCVLIPPDDPLAIAAAVQQVRASSELQTHLGAGARALAAHFTWDKIAQEHARLYKSLI